MVNIMNINRCIKINFSFVVFLLVSLFSGLILKSTLFILCLIFHELGHLFFIKIFKQKIRRLEITGFGLIISANFEIQPLRKGLIYSGGLIFSLFLEAIFLVFNLELLKNINLLIIIINLIPIPPLDGFNILKTFFELLFDEEYSLDLSLDISIIAIVLTIILFFLTKQIFLICIVTFSLSKLIKYKSLKKIIYLKNFLKLNPHKQIAV